MNKSYTTLKFKCINRSYTSDSWDLYDVESLEKIDKNRYNVCPIRDKLMNQDIFYADENNNFVEIKHSSNRQLPIIPAILSLNKMYGKTHNNKYYYKATPDDCRVPHFIVPYKQKQIGFDKKLKNKYIIIKYESWKEKHPIASIVFTIGDVEILPNFYEYMLYCKNLQSSIQIFTKHTLLFLRNHNETEIVQRIEDNPKYNFVNRKDETIITIDPKKCNDFDDAFTINDITLYGKKCKKISVFISHVPIWMDAMDLWNSFSERISTIYLPDRKRPMLPSVLSDNLCSLRENKIRFAFTIDIFVDEKYDIIKYNFSNSVICVKKNYTYCDKELKEEKVFNDVFNVISEMNKKNRMKYVRRFCDSHDVITYLMLLTNYLTAQDLKSYKNGLFRTLKLKTSYKLPNNAPDNVIKFIKGWNSSSSKYVKFEQYGSHDLLKLDAYVHVTSPIRRLVDIVNIMTTMKNNNLFDYTLCNKSQEFFNKWTNDNSIEYINVSMRAIRRLQGRCELLNNCYSNPNMLLKYYDGYCFDKLMRNDGLYQYVIFIPEINVVNKYTGVEDVENFEIRKFQLYLFKDESTFKQKIKMNMIES